MMLHCRDKGWGVHSNYVTEGWGLTFEDFTDLGENIGDEGSYLTKWTLSSKNITYTGEDVKSLLDTLEMLIDKYDLQVRSNLSKDILVIYTDRLFELGCYLKNHLTDVFICYIQVMNNIEFRECWNEDMTTAEDIYKWADDYIQNLFIPDKYFYLTPSQISRKRIYRMCKKHQENLGAKIFPSDYPKFKYIRNSLYGGICYCPYPEMEFNRPIIEIDLKSAYIFAFIKRHCSTIGRRVRDTSVWERYLDDDYKFSIGTYKITYSCWSNRIRCYKTIEGYTPSQEGIHTDTFRFTNKDLRIFLANVNATQVECTELLEFDTDYLPKPVLDCIIDMYMRKETSDGIEKAIAKIILNSIYGNTSRKREEEEFKRLSEQDMTLPPQWGTFITVYCKEMLLAMGMQLEGWIYSDTDSIFCFDTRENRAKIDEFNKKTRLEVKDFCDKFGYDFNVLKNLGAFMIEEEIIRFKAWKQKQYAFQRKDGSVVVKASGCVRREYDASVFDMKSVPVGEKVIRIYPVFEERSTVKDGKKYTSETSYWKLIAEGEDAELLMECAYYADGEVPY